MSSTTDVVGLVLAAGAGSRLQPLTDDLPKRFALGLHDGPPRRFGNRMDFFDDLAKRCDRIVVDDTDDPAYA